MNIIFIAARQHTNYLGILRVLKKSHNIFFNSIYKSNIEDHKFIKPDILKQGILSKFMLFFLSDKYYKFFYFPSFINYFKYLNKVNPELAIVRIGGRFNFYLNLIFLSFFKCKILCHEQKNYNRKDLRFTNIKNFLLYLEWCFLSLVFNVRLFSPIYKKKDKNFYYLPFITHNKKKKKTINKKTNFISIGKFEKRKNFIFLLSALKKISFDYSLLIIGENSNQNHNSYLKLLKNYIKLNGLQKRVKILPNILHRNIFGYFKNKSLFILPSYNEPASISLLESISAGVPVLCSDSCGTKTYIKQNFNGFIFVSNNKKSLVDKINFYVNNKNKFNFYSNNCINYSKKNLSSDNFMFYFNKILSSF